MEFTYDGLVRHAFGFQNPNHAAALFCLLLPWTWAIMAGCRRTITRIAGGATSLTLLVMLVFTYSRTGMIVMLGEAALFVWLYRRAARSPTREGPIRQSTGLWIGLGVLFLAFTVAAVASGAVGRLTGWITNPDKAFTNRFHIWRGGLELFAANPSGVGLGNSGLLYSAFLVPEESNIATRTLVNSFLTVMVEQGAAWGAVALTLLIFAAWAGWRDRRGGLARAAALTALVGGVVSATLSTCFDLSALIHGGALGLTPSQIGMAWLLLAAFVVQVVLLWAWGWSGGLERPRMALIVSVGVSLTVVTILFGVGRGLSDEKAPVVMWSGGAPFATAKVSPTNSNTALLLYDDATDLPGMVRWARRWLPDGTICLPLAPWHMRPALPELPADCIVLRGKCAYLADQAGNHPVTLISPPADLPRPPGTDRVFLRKYVERPPWPLEESDSLRIEYY